MRSKTYTVALILIILIALIVFSWTAVHALLYDPDSTVAVPALTAAAPANATATSSLPARLIIPALNINAGVQYLGINSIGNMQAPDNFVDVGWYKYGTVPGQIGSAVIDGHVNNGLGLNGVFIHLSNIQVGNDVYVETNGGMMLDFVVADIEVYPYQNVPTSMVFSQDDAARLNLITCDGTWVNGQDTYNERLVVYTKYVGES